MKKVITMAILVTAVIAAVPVYAAKPTSLPEQSNGKAYGLLSSENKIMNVYKLNFYPVGTDLVGTEEEPARYDYEMEPWGKGMVKTKDGRVSYNGHNHAMDEEYELYYGDTLINSAMTNEDGDVRITGYLPQEVDPNSEEFEWETFTVRQGETVVLQGTETKLKGMDYEDEEEMEEMEETEM